MNSKTSKAFGIKFTYLLFYSIAAIILFLPVLNKNFVSDDFVVLKRVCLQRTIYIQGFFRPLSDCSIYLNYLLIGLKPIGFNLVNIFIHSINSFLLFEFCLKWKWTTDIVMQRRYALIASILFLTYPFHNEAIVWLLGRGSSLAATFGIAALLIFLSGWNDKAKFFGVCLSYFTGLMAYESIIILPILICLLLIEKKVSSITYFKWAIAFAITGIMHILFRYNFSGALFGSYGEKILKLHWLSYPGNILKVMSRLIIPPIKNSFLFLMISITIVLASSLTVFFTFFRLKKQILHKHFVFILISIIGCTLMVPFLLAVSTRTSESDRLLYLPSLFVCCFISFLICSWIQTRSARQLVVVLLCIYNIIFLELNNYNWFKAGSAIHSILKLLQSDTGSNRIFIANVPNEVNGAYIFREGFKDALIINKIDTSRVSVINKLSKELVTNPDETWKPVFYKTKIFIPPLLQIKTGLQADTGLKSSDTIHYTLPANSKLYYWDQHNFILLKQHAIFFNAESAE